MLGRLGRVLGRIGVRLLVVNLVVLLVPVVGLEFARLYERQLLASLERDMRNQAALVRASLEAELAAGRGLAEHAPLAEATLRRAAVSTRTRVRVLDDAGVVLADSHRDGPPEGHEAEAPTWLPSEVESLGSDVRRADTGPRWPDVPRREEVLGALAGRLSTRTRVRGRAPAVLLFLAEPVIQGGRVRGVVYVTRSTQPVLLELYRIRSGLLELLAIALGITAAITLALAWSISRPLAILAAAARRVAAGELAVPIPVVGSGEIRELGEAFRAMKERLLARLRFSSDFAADVAHELKSPLTSIRGAAELLGEGAMDDPEARARFLRNIELDVARLDQLVSRLLLLGRLEASETAMVPVDLTALAERVAERSSGPDARVLVRVHGVPPVVPGRPADLETALLNLVDNALRHSPAGAPVTVELRRLGGGAEVRVRDFGAGVSPANRAKIFDRFFTTAADDGGTGLGLAIVRAVAEAHGGSIELDAEVTPGAAFVLRLHASSTRAA